MKALFLLLLTFSAHAKLHLNWSIYGEDDRQEVGHVSRDRQEIADSTAALIVNSFLVKKGNKYKVDSPSLEQQDGVCQSERYKNQPAAALCSGTLIGEDLILTASHCYSSQSFCEHASWVFNFHEDTQNRYEIPVKEVYGCKSILYKEFDLKTGKDFAVIQLDRKVKNHNPVKLFQGNSSFAKGTSLFTIGHPRGLPTKVAENGEILSFENNVLMTNLDSFTGNSGSGVFHSGTLELIGVLSYGKEDYEEDNENVCTRSAVYQLQDGGEAVMGIGPVRDFLNSNQNSRP